jgi:hypothetical protein
MKQILLCVTLATAIASSTLAAHSETVPKTLQQKLSTQQLGGSSLSIPGEPCVFIPDDPVLPASRAKQGSSVFIPTEPFRPESAIGIGKKGQNSGNLRMLNPQPLPPGG